MKPTPRQASQRIKKNMVQRVAICDSSCNENKINPERSQRIITWFKMSKIKDHALNLKGTLPKKKIF